MTDPSTTIAREDAPNLAIDVVPSVVEGTFTVDVSVLDDPDLLGWADDPDAWVNIVCDVTRVTSRRGATRLQGVLTRAEAGIATIEVLDAERRFDPLLNADAIHAGTPLRLRAWGELDVLVLPATPARRNYVPNPRLAANVTGWTVNAGTGGTAAVTRVAAAGPGGEDVARATWTVASTATGSGQLRADGRTSTGLPIVVVPGEVLSGSMLVRSSIAQRLALVLTFFDAAGAQTGIVPTGGAGPAQVVGAGSWVTLGINGLTVPAGAVRALLGPQAVTGTGAVVWPVGATLDATHGLLEVAAVAGPYFDGSTADEPVAEGAHAYAWEGAADASASLDYLYGWGVEGWSAVLFTASLDDVPVVYARTGPPRVALTASDRISDLAEWQAIGRDPEVGAGDDLLERITRVLDETGIVGALAADVDTSYVATLGSTALADAWGDITGAADAELGRVWVNRDDELVVRGRESQLSGPVRGTLSDWHGEGEGEFEPHCCYDDLAATLGTETLTNRAIAGRRDPAGGSGGTLVQRDDTYSQALYRRVRTVDRRDLVLAGDDQLAPWCESVIVTGSRPELRVDTVSPAPWGAGDEAWQAALSTDLGDRWVLRYHPEQGPTVMSTVGLLGIEHEITPEGWVILWTTTEAPTPGDDNPTGWFVVGGSDVDGGDLLAPFGGAVPAPPP